MTNEHSPRRILEIGPAQMPLHHRGTEFRLAGDETYTAVDQGATVFNTAVWDALKEAHPGRVLTLQGDSHDLPIPDEPYDEVVCLGSVVTDAAIRRLVEQMPKILKPGGKLRLGFTIHFADFNVADFCDKWNVEFRQNGLYYQKPELQAYPYGKRRRKRLDKEYPDDPESTQYAVLTYEKRAA